MPDKLGSEERSTRDPTTPDPLAGRLRSEKLRRAKAREMAAQERALTTPVAAAAADLHLAEAGSVSASELSRETPAAPPARKSLDYESKPAAKDNKSASGKQDADEQEMVNMFNLDHRELVTLMTDKIGADEAFTRFLIGMEMDGRKEEFVTPATWTELAVT